MRSIAEEKQRALLLGALHGLVNIGCRSHHRSRFLFTLNCYVPAQVLNGVASD